MDVKILNSNFTITRTKNFHRIDSFSITLLVPIKSNLPAKMKKDSSPSSPAAESQAEPSGNSSNIDRRQFVKLAGAGALAFSIVPRYVLGGPGHVAPSDKVTLAYVGCGTQGF